MNLRNSNREFLIQSLGIHFILVAIFSVVVFLGPKRTEITRYQVEVKEVLVAAPVETIKPEINLTQKIPEPAPAPVTPPKKVFGITKDTMTSNDPSAVSVKLGTTLAKEVDNEIIDEKDAVGLPVPTAEYLVNEMPKLKSEVRIPYPPEAKKKNIEGVVLMDLLIDENGKVRQATLIEGPGFGLNEAAMSAIKGFEFQPAKVDGKPVAVRIRYGYRFVLQ